MSDQVTPDQPTPEPPVGPVQPGLLTEHGAPFPGRWDKIEIPETTMPRLGRDILQVDQSELSALLRRERVDRHGRSDRYSTEDDFPPIPATDPDHEQREHLIYLQRWVGPTEYSQERVDHITGVIARYVEQKKKIPHDVERDLRIWSQKLADAQERDRIQATRADDCFCLSLGGRDEIAVCVRDPESGRVLFSEADGPMTWGHYCGCPEGKQARLDAAEARAAMRVRGLARRQDNLLGRAQIPPSLLPFGLDVFPDQGIAARCRGWYFVNTGEQPADDRVKKWLLLSGPNRRGKTTLAVGIMRLALDRSSSVIFWKAKRLLDELRSTYDEQNPLCHRELLDLLEQTPLLVLDDLGAESWSGWVETTLCDLLDARMLAGRLTIITTNLGWRLDAGPDDVFDGSELTEFLSARIALRIREQSNHLPVLGPILGVDGPWERPPTDVPDTFERW